MYLKAIINVYELGFKEVELHLVQELPQDLQPYRNNYIYCQSEEALYYVDFTGMVILVTINKELFKDELERLKKERAQLTTYDIDIVKQFLIGTPFLASKKDPIPAYLNYKPKKEITRLNLNFEEIETLITSNGGHVPHVLSDETLTPLMETVAIYGKNLSSLREKLLSLFDFLKWLGYEEPDDIFHACNQLMKDLDFSPQDLKKVILQIQRLNDLGFLTPPVCEDLKILYLETKNYSSPLNLELSEMINKVTEMINSSMPLRFSTERLECFEEDLSDLLTQAQEEARIRKEAYDASLSEKVFHFVDDVNEKFEENERRESVEQDLEKSMMHSSELSPVAEKVDPYAVSLSVAVHSQDTLFALEKPQILTVKHTIVTAENGDKDPRALQVFPSIA